MKSREPLGCRSFKDRLTDTCRRAQGGIVRKGFICRPNPIRRDPVIITNKGEKVVFGLPHTLFARVLCAEPCLGHDTERYRAVLPARNCDLGRTISGSIIDKQYFPRRADWNLRLKMSQRRRQPQRAVVTAYYYGNPSHDDTIRCLDNEKLIRAKHRSIWSGRMQHCDLDRLSGDVVGVVAWPHFS